MNLDSIYQAWRESGIDLLGGGDWNLFAAKLSERLAQPEQEPVAQYSDIVSNGGMDPRNKFDTHQSPDVALVRQLVDALRVGVRQNEHDMLMTGEELRASSSAIEAGQQWLKDRSCTTSPQK